MQGKYIKGRNSMKKINLKINCCLCPNNIIASTSIPKNWALIDDIEKDGFCNKHSNIEPFLSSQCSGCVGGWMDCRLWRSFAFSEPTITENDLETLKKGICPQRTNGTSFLSANSNLKLEDLNLDNIDIQSGTAFANAIVEYIAKYKLKSKV